mgnify:CR=1 FL=1
MEAGKRYGLTPKIHADEIEAIGGSQLAGEVGAISAEHLIVCPQEGGHQMGPHEGGRDVHRMAPVQVPDDLEGLQLVLRRQAGPRGPSR